MVTYVCDDRQVERLLVRLEREIRELGAWIHPEAQVCCEQGDLSIRAEGALARGKPLILLPEQALLPVDDIDFAIRDNVLRLATPPSHLSRERRRLLDTMLEIYARTRKIAAHRATSPWIALADRPDVIETLVEGRSTAGAIRRYHCDMLAGVDDRLVLDSFLRTRTLNFKAPPQDPGPVLMPVIDFINHHPAAPSFQRGADMRGNRGVGILKATPVATSNECYVRYGVYDALDIYLFYGFVEKSAPVVRSVPLDIELDGIGRIEVHATMGSKKTPGKLPPHLDAVRQFVPAVRPAGDGHLVVSHLLVPAGPPAFGLQRILAELAATMRPGLDRIAVQNRVAAAEAEIISKNVDFYEKLIRQLGPDADRSRDASPVAMVREIARIQLAKLAAYERMTRAPCG